MFEGYKPAEVHHGEMVSLYLKHKQPLPEWAQYRIFPRSGSSLTVFSVFVPDSTRLQFNVEPNDKFWWPAVNGIIYSFRHREDAESLIEVLTQ